MFYFWHTAFGCFWRLHFVQILSCWMNVFKFKTQANMCIKSHRFLCHPYRSWEFHDRIKYQCPGVTVHNGRRFWRAQKNVYIKRIWWRLPCNRHCICCDLFDETIKCWNSLDPPALEISSTVNTHWNSKNPPVHSLQLTHQNRMMFGKLLFFSNCIFLSCYVSGWVIQDKRSFTSRPKSIIESFTIFHRRKKHPSFKFQTVKQSQSYNNRHKRNIKIKSNMSPA